MLTGDKMETAENIGLSCNLIDKEFELLRLMQNNEQEAQNYLGTYQDKMNLARSKKKRVCTVIDGICLGVILKDKERAIQYLNIMKDCESVICCRVTPMQKADVVRLVRFIPLKFLWLRSKKISEKPHSLSETARTM